MEINTYKKLLLLLCLAGMLGSCGEAKPNLSPQSPTTPASETSSSELTSEAASVTQSEKISESFSEPVSESQSTSELSSESASELQSASESASTSTSQSASTGESASVTNNGPLQLYKPVQEASTVLQVERLKVPEKIEGKRLYLEGLVSEHILLVRLSDKGMVDPQNRTDIHGLYDLQSGEFVKIMDTTMEDGHGVYLSVLDEKTVLIQKTENNWMDVEFLTYRLEDQKIDSITKVHFDQGFGMMQNPILDQNFLYLNTIRDGHIVSMKYDIAHSQSYYGEEGILPHYDENGEVKYLPLTKQDSDPNAYTLGFSLPGAYKVHSYDGGWAKTSKRDYLLLDSNAKEDLMKGHVLYQPDTQEFLMSCPNRYAVDPEHPDEQEGNETVFIDLRSLKASPSLLGFDIESQEAFGKLLYDDKKQCFLNFSDLPQQGNQQVYMAPKGDLGIICTVVYPSADDKEAPVTYTIDKFMR